MLTILLVALVVGLVLLCGGSSVLFATAMADRPEDDTDTDTRLAVVAFWAGLALTVCSVAALVFDLLLWLL